MRTKRFSFVFLSGFLGLGAIVTLMLLANRSTCAASSTLYVAPGGDCGGASPCYATIQEAVDASSDAVIKVAQGVYTSPAFEIVYLSKAVSVIGGYAPPDWEHSYPLTQATILDAQQVARRRGVYIDAGDTQTVTLEGLTIQHSSLPDADGAGIYVSSGTVVLRHLQVLSNTVNANAGKGAGVFGAAGRLVVEDSVFAGNSGADGAGLYFAGNSLILSRSVFRGNEGQYAGGGAAATATGSIEVTGNVFEGNQAPGFAPTVSGGGGLYASGPVVSVTGNVFRDNDAAYGGGATIVGSVVTLTVNGFTGNAYESDGGGAHISGVTITVRSNVFDGNRPSHSGSKGGGGLYLEGRATEPFGHDYGPVAVTENRFQDNSGRYGGGAHVASGMVHMHGNTFSSNAAEVAGGGLYVDQTTYGWGSTVLTTTANLFLGNALDPQPDAVGGGSIAIYGGTVYAVNDIIAQTMSATEAIYLASGDLAAVHLTLANNGPYALTTGGGTAVLTNTIVATQTVGAFAGKNIRADHTLFFDSGIPCSSGAVCANSLTGDPGFVSPASGDYHITPASTALDRGVATATQSDIDGEVRSFGGGPDLGADEWATAEVTITPTVPSVLVATAGGLTTTVAVPAGAVTETIRLVYSARADAGHAAPEGWVFAGTAFDLEAYLGNALLAGLSFDVPVTITVHYAESDARGLSERSLLLLLWDGTGWQDAVCGAYERSPQGNWLSAPVCHLSRFALFGEPVPPTYLPLVLRGSSPP